VAQDQPFRFATSLQATSCSELIAPPRTVEELGYSAVVATDHVGTPLLAPIFTLAAVAALRARPLTLSRGSSLMTQSPTPAGFGYLPDPR
jgi:hypothetical protein